METMLTTDQVAELLHVHWQTVLNYIKRGELRAVRLYKGYRIERADLDDFIERKKQSAVINVGVG